MGRSSDPSPGSPTGSRGHTEAQPKPKANTGTRTYRLPWAHLLKNVFAVDGLACPDCGGRLQIIAFIADDAVARRIFLHLGLDSRGTPVASDLPRQEKSLKKMKLPVE